MIWLWYIGIFVYPILVFGIYKFIKKTHIEEHSSWKRQDVFFYCLISIVPFLNLICFVLSLIVWLSSIDWWNKEVG